MPEYRFYCVTVGANPGRGDFIQAEDDAGAIAMVINRHPDSECELWDGDRLVAKIPRMEREA